MVAIILCPTAVEGVVPTFVPTISKCGNEELSSDSHDLTRATLHIDESV